MGDVGAAYAGCRKRITEMVGDRGDQRSDHVPACPEWSVHDVVAHLAGVVDDALAGRLDGVATDAWTDAQVAARRHRPLSEVLAEWEDKAPAFEGLLDAIGDPGRQAVADVVTHEHDIRGALRQPGARDSDAVRIGLGFIAPAFVASAASAAVSVRVRASDGSEFGPEDADLILTGEPFELLRAMTGRRSTDQIRAMSWAGDAESALAAFEFGPFRPAARPIHE